MTGSTIGFADSAPRPGRLHMVHYANAHPTLTANQFRPFRRRVEKELFPRLP
jgi:hypothetical protein